MALIGLGAGLAAGLAVGLGAGLGGAFTSGLGSGFLGFGAGFGGGGSLGRRGKRCSGLSLPSRTSLVMTTFSGSLGPE